MTADFATILHEILFGSLKTVFSVLRVLIPLMILIELLSAYRVIDRLASKLVGLTKTLGLSPPSIVPLLVATIMGVTYGAGTLMEMNKEKPLPRKDFLLIAVFFFVCHGIIETTGIWGAAGANVFVISIGRLLLAAAATMVAARLPFFRRMDTAQELDMAREKPGGLS